MKAELKTQVVDSYKEARELCERLNVKNIPHSMVQQGERFFVFWAQIADTSLESADFTLIDEAIGDQISGQIHVKGDLGVSLSFDGYGDCCSDDSSGSPVYIEKYDGRVMVRIYANINSEEPTHNIDLSGAALSNRVEKTA